MSREAAMAIATGNPAPPPLAEAPAQAAEQKPVDLDSTRFNHLAKKEAEIVKQREETKRERELLSAELEKYKPIFSKREQIEKLRESDPIAAMRMDGYNEAQIMNFLAAAEDTSTPEERARRAAQEEIKKFQDDQARIAKENQERLNTQTLDNFRKMITQTVTADKEKYEYCNHYGEVAEQLIFDTVDEVLKKDGVVISTQEAADLVETYYEEEDRAMSGLKKRTPREELMAKLSQPTPEAPLKAEVSARPTTPSKTLNSKAVATAASQITRKESPEEKRQRLIERLKNGG